MTAVPLGETPSLCITCPEARPNIARSGGATCWYCHDRLQQMLIEVVQRYARLSARPQGGADFGRRAPGFASRPPVNIHIAALRDPRTAPITLGEAHSPLNLLITWGRWVRDARGQTRARYPQDFGDLAIAYVEGQYLDSALDWVTRQPWVPKIYEQTRAVVSQLRKANGEPNPRPFAQCECGSPLFPPRDGDLVVRCAGCELTYDPLAQIELVRRRTTCKACAHGETQHSNDDEIHACNVQWCDCAGFQETP